MKPHHRQPTNQTTRPAAFGRLCVETNLPNITKFSVSQPPSGGCVLKHPLWLQTANGGAQPPSGGCVLKQFVQPVFKLLKAQPPSGGCVLKLTMGGQPQQNLMPAAFGRLCVETAPEPAPGKQPRQPPSGGCVLKQDYRFQTSRSGCPSRLRAAVC